MNREQQRFQAAVAAMQGILSSAHPNAPTDPDEVAKHSALFADALLAELDRTKPEPETPQPEGFPDFQKWTAYEGLGTIKEGEEDIFAHRNLSSLTERHNRVIAALREWAERQSKTPQPDADGWIPHCPGDPMPCAEDFKVAVRFIDGIEDESNTAGFWRGVGGASSFWDESGEETIIAWKPA